MARIHIINELNRIRFSYVAIRQLISLWILHIILHIFKNFDIVMNMTGNATYVQTSTKKCVCLRLFTRFLTVLTFSFLWDGRTYLQRKNWSLTDAIWKYMHACIQIYTYIKIYKYLNITCLPLQGKYNHRKPCFPQISRNIRISLIDIAKIVA